MTEDYKPTDNAIAERVNGIIKQEWLYRMKTPPDVARDWRGSWSTIGDLLGASGTCFHLSGSEKL